jgi:protein-S-isoprenylcysteine O-methyltransferase Ste14
MKKRILPDDCFCTLLAFAILFHFIFPIKRIIPHPANFIGIAIVAIGIAMTLFVNLLLLKNGTSIKPYESPSLLVTSGLFKFSRNPLYLGMVIALFGVSIFLGSISPFIFSILFIIIVDRYFIPIEEEKLERNFGKEFNEYKKKVRRWI